MFRTDRSLATCSGGVSCHGLCLCVCVCVCVCVRAPYTTPLRDAFRKGAFFVTPQIWCTWSYRTSSSQVFSINEAILYQLSLKWRLEVSLIWFISNWLHKTFCCAWHNGYWHCLHLVYLLVKCCWLRAPLTPTLLFSSNVKNFPFLTINFRQLAIPVSSRKAENSLHSRVTSNIHERIWSYRLLPCGTTACQEQDWTFRKHHRVPEVIVQDREFYQA
jgi:hypothetical protein